MFEYLIVIGLLTGQETSGMAGCRLIEDDDKRLACYDSASGRRPGNGAVPEAAKIPPDVTPAAMDFGLTEEQRNQTKDVAPEIDKIVSRVAVVERQAFDRYTMTLENGQKWKQLEPTPIQRFRVGDAITIRKAAMESYIARGPSSGPGVRVRRVD